MTLLLFFTLLLFLGLRAAGVSKVRAGPWEQPPTLCRLSVSRKGAWFRLQGWLPSPQRPQQVPQRRSQGAWSAWLRSTVPPRGFLRASSGCPVSARGRSQSTAFACHLPAGGGLGWAGDGSPLWDLLFPPPRQEPPSYLRERSEQTQDITPGRLSLPPTRGTIPRRLSLRAGDPIREESTGWESITWNSRGRKFSGPTQSLCVINWLLSALFGKSTQFGGSRVSSVWEIGTIFHSVKRPE